MLSQSQLIDYVQFPEPSDDDEGLLCGGGDLAPEMLISAYRQGAFPWFNAEDPIMWWSPTERCVVKPGEVSITKNMKRLIRQKKHTISCDTQFFEVIQNCSTIKRKNEDGTWISDQIIEAYTLLHQLGIAHSIEVNNQNGDLVGGLYGVSIGDIFYGESMFSKESNASKIAFIHLSEFLKQQNFKLIDCQITNPHLTSLGTYEILREDFIKENHKLTKEQTRIGSWTATFKKFCAGYNI